MSARAGQNRLAVVVAVVAGLVLALFIAPALGSDRMPPRLLSAAIAVLAVGVAAVALLAPEGLRPLASRAAGAAIACTTLPVLAYAAACVIAAGGRVSDYHFSDRAAFTAVVAFHLLWGLTWLAATWSHTGQVRASAADLWTWAVAVPVAATATLWLSGNFVHRVTGFQRELLIAYAVAQPLGVLVAALRSRVGRVARVFAPLTTVAIGLALNVVLISVAISQSSDD